MLTGDHQGLRFKELPENAVLVARNMGPAELLEYDRTRLRGVVLEEGASISHVAIIARSLGLVAVGQAENIVSMSETGDDVIVDGPGGVVHLRPTAEIKQSYVDKVRITAKRAFFELKDRPSVTQDGVNVTLLHNSGLVADLPMLDDTGASGVGLFRTELQFMIASRLPRLAEQVELYSQALKIVGDRPIVFRLLDIGGDKVIPYLRSAAEENPAMGWRSLRLALDRPGLLRTQVRALLMAADGKPLKILVPMVTGLPRFRQDAARGAQGNRAPATRPPGQRVPERIELGAMIEVPSLLFELDHLLPEADFVSIGSNDLVQFLTAADRANPRVSKSLPNPIFMPRLRVFRHIVDAKQKRLQPCRSPCAASSPASRWKRWRCCRSTHDQALDGTALDRTNQGNGDGPRFSSRSVACGRRRPARRFGRHPHP